MTALTSAVLILAQTAASFPGLSPDWVAAPSLQPFEYGHFSRHVPGGPDESLVATSRTCNCDPHTIINELETTFSDKPAAVINDDPVTACGQTVQHFTVEGVADTTGRRNVELYALRNGGALVLIAFYFTKAAPTPADEASMQALCPASSTPAASAASPAAVPSPPATGASPSAS